MVIYMDIIIYFFVGCLQHILMTAIRFFIGNEIKIANQYDNRRCFCIDFYMLCINDCGLLDYR